MALEDIKDLFPQIRRKRIRHYYGDVTRHLFLIAGGVMIIFIPLQGSLLPMATVIFVAGILLIGVLAGLTDPRRRSIAVMNVGISAIGLVIFEYYAAIGYREQGFSLDFLAHQAIALLFFFALYFSTKTLRAMISGRLPSSGPEEPFNRASF